MNHGLYILWEFLLKKKKKTIESHNAKRSVTILLFVTPIGHNRVQAKKKILIPDLYKARHFWAHFKESWDYRSVPKGHFTQVLDKENKKLRSHLGAVFFIGFCIFYRIVLLRSQHSSDSGSLYLFQVSFSVCINCHLLQKEASQWGWKDVHNKSLGVGLILCTFNGIIVVDSPIGPMTCLPA